MHQVFTYLSEVAMSESQNIRANADAYLTRIVEEKVREVMESEEQLRNEVERLWVKFEEGVEKEASAALGVDAKGVVKRRQSHARKVSGSSPAPGAGGGATSASVRITDFVLAPVIPTARTTARNTPAPARQVTSALSASLAESSFQYRPPVAQTQVVSTQPTVPNANANPATNGHAHHTTNGHGYPTTNGYVHPTGLRSPNASVNGHTLSSPLSIGSSPSSIRDAHRRNMDQGIDTATSFRYFELEAQMEAARRERERREAEASPSELEVGADDEKDEEDGQRARAVDEISPSALARGRSPKISKSAIKKPKEEHVGATVNDASASADAKGKKPRSTSRSEGGSQKGKRKVTFVVMPDIAIIGRTDGEGEGVGAVKGPKDEGKRLACGIVMQSQY